MPQSKRKSGAKLCVFYEMLCVFCAILAGRGGRGRFCLYNGESKEGVAAVWRVLIADDEGIERKYLKSIFQKWPQQYRVVAEAATSEQALALALETRPDVLILDISMPGAGGLEVARQVKERLPAAAVLLNTAYAEFEFAQKAVEYHLDAYLLKPSSEETLLRTLEELLQSRPASQPGSGASAPQTLPVAEYIRAHFARPLSLKELAEVAHFSPSYLSHLFHEEYGLTLKAFISQQRIRHAEELLASSALTVKEVCARCGFANISHFNRVFKQLTGKAPGEYRKEQ